MNENRAKIDVNALQIPGCYLIDLSLTRGFIGATEESATEKGKRKQLM